MLDKLGLSASMGLDVMLRQTLYGGHYAMIDDDLNPMPVSNIIMQYTYVCVHARVCVLHIRE